MEGHGHVGMLFNVIHDSFFSFSFGYRCFGKTSVMEECHVGVRNHRRIYFTANSAVFSE